MILLEAFNIKHYVKDRLLLDVDRLTIYKNDRIGLVGRNGSGKTTLLNILAGMIASEKGNVIRHARCELLSQLKQMDTTKSGGEVTQAYIHDLIAKTPDFVARTIMKDNGGCDGILCIASAMLRFSHHETDDFV